MKLKKVFFAVLLGLIILFSSKCYAGNTTVDALKAKFPAGKFWNHWVGEGHRYVEFEDRGSCNNPDGYTDTPCSYHDGTTAHAGQTDCSSFDGGQECAGFARKLFYDYYGVFARSMSTHTNLNSIKPGDVVRYEGDGAASGGHEVWVIGVTNEYLIVGECNWYKNCEISWDRWVKKANITSIVNVYSAPYEINDNKDTEAPKFSDGQIVLDSITEKSFKVRVKATDNVGIDYINFGAKAPNDTQFGPWQRMSLSNGYYEATIKASDHNNQKGLYQVHCYAFDKEGNSTGFVFPNFIMGSKIVTDLGNFNARIVPKSSTTYAIGVDGNASSSNVSLKGKSLNDSSQIWKFENVGNNKYKITNYSNNYALDVYGGKDTNNNNVTLYTSNTSNAQRYYIMSYNGAYRIVPLSSVTAKAINIANDSIKAGSNIEIYDVKNASNNSQTFKFEKLTTSISLNTKSLNLNVGDTKTLTATIKPTDVATKNVTWSSSNTSVATVSTSGLVTAKGAGTTTIMAKAADGANVANVCSVTVTQKNASVNYTTHVQNVGWQSYVKDGAMSGTSGKSLRIEGIKIKLTNMPVSGGIQYRTHVQNIGWQNWVSNDTMAGTSGKGLRLEAIQIKLTGEMANKYDVYYRVHAQEFGWLGWAKNGASAGTEGYSYRIEAIEIKLIEKGKTGPASTVSAFYNGNLTPSVNYTTHVQNIGWQSYVKDGAMSGTSGKSLRLEGIKVKLTNMPTTGGIQYRTHVQNIGWQSWVSNNTMAGTSGKSLRLEAIQIKLTGKMAEKYDVYYRVHAQNLGWLGWAKNGASAGTQGYSYRLEGIQIKLVKKGGSAPGSTANAFKSK